MKVKAIDLSNASKKSRAYISAETKRGHLLRDSDGNYNLENSLNKNWVVSKGIKISDFKNKESKVKPETPKTVEKEIKTKSQIKKLKKKNASNLTPVEFEEMIGLPEELKNLTIEELVLQFGNLPGIKAWAETLDKIMSGMKKSVEIQKIKHDLIERDFFRSHVKSYLDVLSEQLFNYCGTDKKRLKDMEKMIQHTQRNIDRELSKMQKIQELTIGK